MKSRRTFSAIHAAPTPTAVRGSSHLAPITMITSDMKIVMKNRRFPTTSTMPRRT